MGAAAAPWDTSALTAPIDRTAVRSAGRRARPGGVLGALGPVGRPLLIVVAVMIGLIVLLVLGSLLASLPEMLAGGGAFPILVLALIAVVVAGIAAAVVGATRGLRRWDERRMRLNSFAAANEFVSAGTVTRPALPGLLFNVGGARRSEDVIRIPQPRWTEVGNYRYSTGRGRDRVTHQWGYLAVRLSRALPHIVLDAVDNNAPFGVTNLPVGFERGQRLSLEGDFDRVFALYCPQGYERDALYLFTPDVMALFADAAGRLDAEIVDDWLFLYSGRDLSTLDPATWERVNAVLVALDGKLGQWARWRDERADAPLPTAHAREAASATVAAGGRRLQRRAPWGALAVVALVAVVWGLAQSGVLASWFGG